MFRRASGPWLPEWWLRAARLGQSTDSDSEPEVATSSTTRRWRRCPAARE